MQILWKSTPRGNTRNITVILCTNSTHFRFIYRNSSYILMRIYVLIFVFKGINMFSSANTNDANISQVGFSIFLYSVFATGTLC